MAKDVNIKRVEVQAIKSIEVDGKSYPVHQHNIGIVEEYEATGNDAVLDKLVDFAFSF